MSLISFILPFYNEEQTLPLVVQSIRRVMEPLRYDFEMIFVNDASMDRSAAVLSQESAKGHKGDIVLVNMSRRFGVEESFMAGIGVAKGDALVLMYTDLQDPPEVVVKMLESFENGSEVVHGIRRRRIGENPLKKLAAFVAYRLIAAVADIQIPKDAGEFKLISRNVAEHLLKLPEAEPYLRGLIPWIGFKQTYVEYDLQPRVGGKSNVPLFGKKAWSVFFSGIVSFSDFPIYLILTLGFVGVLTSVLLQVLSGGCRGGVSGPLLMFFWATLMLAVGLVGLYVLKIYKNTRGRPRYIIKEVQKLGHGPKDK